MKAIHLRAGQLLGLRAKPTNGREIIGLMSMLIEVQMMVRLKTVNT